MSLSTRPSPSRYAGSATGDARRLAVDGLAIPWKGVMTGSSGARAHTAVAASMCRRVRREAAGRIYSG